MDLPGSFLITSGELQLVGPMQGAAQRYENRPPDEEMESLMDEFDIRAVFP